MSSRWEAILRRIQRHGEEYRAEDDDTVLLNRFTTDRDPAAFEALLKRYGSMVYRACCRILPSEQDAEDAFQATFLKLVRNAASIRRQVSLAGWLHKTAVRLSWKIQAQAHRRQTREQKCARPEASCDVQLGDEVLTVLDEELDRLPDKYRHPVILCRLLDRPLTDAASELGLSVTTIWRRLQDAEILLRDRLTRRGVSVSVAVLAGVFSASEAGASPPVAAGLVRSAVALGDRRFADVPARLIQLSRPDGWSAKALTAIAFVIGIGVALAAVAVYNAATPPPQPLIPPQANENPAPAPPVSPLAVLTGSVVDPVGRPVPRARLSVLARRWERSTPGLRDDLIATAETSDDGQFRIPIAPFTAQGSENSLFVVASSPDGRVTTVAPVSLVPGETPAPVPLKLPDGRGLSGVVLDDANQPVSGATVAVTRFGGAANDPPSERDTLLPKGLWPANVITGRDGRFTIPGFDPSVGYRLSVIHPERGVGCPSVLPRTANANITVRLMPVVPITGQVLAADTGQAMPGSRASVVIHIPDNTLMVRYVPVDADGRFVVMAPRGSKWIVRGMPANPAEYLSTEVTIVPGSDPNTSPSGPKGEKYAGQPGPGIPAVGGLGGGFPAGGPAAGDGKPGGKGKSKNAGTEPAPLVFRLPRSATIRGHVIDSDSGQPVVRAKIWFIPHTAVETGGLTVVCGNRASVMTDDNGKFELPTPAVAGAVLALGPSHDYVPRELDAGVLAGDKPTGKRLHAHAILSVDADRDSAVTLRLTRGEVIEGFAVRDDGSPVPDGRVLCRHVVGGRDLQTILPLPVRNGRFTIPGCSSGQVYSVQVIDPAVGQGAVAHLRCPAHKDKPAMVRLEPCGEATVELVTPSGRPVVGCRPTLSTVFPGDGFQLTLEGKWWDPDSLEDPTAPNGRATLKGLIPGASYQLRFAKGDTVCYSEFKLKPREMTRLKTIMPTPEE